MQNSLSNDWLGWKITDKQAEEIRQGDKNAINKFYFENLKRLRAFALSYLRRQRKKTVSLEDLLQNLYIDLYYFKRQNGEVVTNGLLLSRFVWASFRFCEFGGLLLLSQNNPKILCNVRTYTCDTLSLDTPPKFSNQEENEKTNYDYIVAPEIEDIPQQDFENVENVFKDLLPPKQGEYMKYLIYGYLPKNICFLMGCSRVDGYANLARKTLRKYYVQILERLNALGYDTSFYKNLEPYNPKTDRKFKLSEEERAKRRESALRLYYKKKQDKLKQAP